MSKARGRAVPAATAVTAVLTTALALVAPAAGAVASHRPLPAKRLASLTKAHDRGARVRAVGARRGAKVDQTLLTKRGLVDVMLQLAPVPAVVPYAAVKAPKASLAPRRLAAFHGQVDRIKTAQRAVTSHFSARSTRAQTLFTVHNLYDGVAVRTDASRLDALSQLPGVVAVHALVPKKLDNAVTVPLIGAPSAWQGVSGDTGKNITIGIIDTGIDYTHADFGGAGTTAAYDAADLNQTQAPQWTAKVVGGKDFAGDSYDPAAGPVSQGGDGNPLSDATPKPDPNPIDCSGHGTHVAGTAAGYGVTKAGTTYTGGYSNLAGLAPSDYQSMFKIGPGVAPDAKLYALKIFGCSEEGGTSSDLITAALDYAAAPDGNPAHHLNVVNMSLGADFTTAEDPDAVAANNASLAGVTVVAAAGNAGDEFFAAGAPGNAMRAISVAASDDTTDLVDGVDFSDLTGHQPAEESSAFDWAHSVDVTGTLATIGTATDLASFRSPGDTNNSDGCDPLSAADAAKVAGKIALLAWTDNDSARRCGSATRTQNAFAAGARGVVLADDEDEFSAGILGTSDIPTVITTKTASDKVASDVLAGQAVTATLSYSLHNAVTDVHDNTKNAIATFSSRGGGASGIVKPDLSAPGVTVFSALYGSGNDGTSNNGTSMATPHVAGSAALVLAAHPSWKPEQVKAALMNTANQDVYARNADSSANTSAPEAPERVGAGRVQADSAVKDSVLAYASGGTGAVSVSFGTISAAAPTTLYRSVVVQNTGAAPVTYTASYAAANANPGAAYSLTTTTCAGGSSNVSVTVAGNSSKTVYVCLTITPSKLTATPDPTLTLKPTLTDPYSKLFPNGLTRSFLSTASGRLVLTPQAGGSTLRVPVYAAPRPASTMTQPGGMAFSGATSHLSLTGTGLAPAAPPSGSSNSVIRSTADAFELQGVSGALPICTKTQMPPGCAPTSEDRAGDLKYVGYTSDGPFFTEYGTDQTFDPWSLDPAGDGSVPPALGYFGLATNGPWTAPDFGIYLVWMDIDGDGQPDAVLYNTRIPGTDIFVSELASVDSTGTPQFVYDDEVINLADGSRDTHLFDSDVMTMPFTLAALKWILVDKERAAQGQQPIDPSTLGSYPDPTGRMSYYVQSGTIDAGLIDSVGDPTANQTPMTVDPANPGLYASNPAECSDSTFTADVCFSTAVDDQPGASLTVHRTATLLSDRPAGLLVLHHDNRPGARAQVVHFATTTTASLARTTAPYGYHDPLTVHVSSTVSVPPGTVSVYEGRTRLASGSLHNGAVTLSLPLRSVGRHTLTVTYAGSTAFAPSSRTLTLTVTKAASKTTISVSGSRTVSITAAAWVLSPGHSGKTGTMSFYDNGHRFAYVRTSGSSTVRRTLSAGKHTITAIYSGNSTLYGSRASVTHTA